MTEEIKLPKSVRVGNRNYKIEPLRKASDLTTLSTNGAHCFETGIIEVVDTLDQERTAETLLHEILHACWIQGDLPDSDEEHMVTMLARVLTQVWQDNPEVMEFIGKNARGI